LKESSHTFSGLFEVLLKAKQNDGRVGNEKTILDENRHITFYEDYADGQTRSVEIDSTIAQVHAHEDTTNFIRQVSNDLAKQATKKNP
jgi:hypothetical protein